MAVEQINHIEHKLKDLKPVLREKFQVSRIGYSGSLATGEFDSESDIDLLVEFSKPMGWEFFDLKAFPEERPVDSVTKKALRNSLGTQCFNRSNICENDFLKIKKS